MKNTLLLGSLLAWVASLLFTPRPAFCDNIPRPGPKSVDTLLREWGENVKYAVWYDRENEEYKTLRQMGSAAVPGLLSALGRSGEYTLGHSWTRDTAAFMLLELGPEASEAVPGLTGLLSHADWGVRRWASVILGRIGREGQPAVPRLLEMLKSKGAAERGVAATALGDIGCAADKVTPALLPLLADGQEDVRRAAVVALGRFRGAAKETAPQLFALVLDPNQDIRESVVWALREIVPEQNAAIDQAVKRAAEADRKRYEATFRRDGGLHCRAVAATNKIEQGMPLEVSFLAWSTPAELPSGVRCLNTFLVEEFLTLHLTNTTTAEVFSLDIEPWDPGPGSCSDSGQGARMLDGRSLGPWKPKFRLVRLRDQLKPGAYECAVELAMPKTKPKYWRADSNENWLSLDFWRQEALRLFKRGPSADWRGYGFWSGQLRSSPFQLEIVKEIPKQRELFAPGPLYFETAPDGTSRLVLKKEEALPLRLGTRNAYYLGQEFRLSTGSGMEEGSYDWRKQDHIFNIAEGDRKVRFEVKIYETSTPPRYHCEPGPGDGGYKILWQQLFETNLAKAFP